MDTFTDYYKNTVNLSFADHPFSDEPKHVLVITRYNNRWLLTRHKTRGLEFPGGKVEEHENAEAAAIREVEEETGGVVSDITYIGQYFVDGKREQIVKNVYYAEIERLIDKADYFETNGPMLIEKLPKEMKYDHRYSFIMKDAIVKKCIKYINKNIK